MTDVVAAGCVVVWVSAVLLADWVLLVSSPAALETAPVAAFAALDAALLADPDPQPLSSAVAIPSASAATTIGRRAVNLTVVSPLIAVRVDLGCMVLGVVTHSCFLLLSASPHSSVTTDEADTRGAMVPPSRFVSILPTAPMARTLTSGQPGESGNAVGHIDQGPAPDLGLPPDRHIRVGHRVAEPEARELPWQRLESAPAAPPRSCSSRTPLGGLVVIERSAHDRPYGLSHQRNARYARTHQPIWPNRRGRTRT